MEDKLKVVVADDVIALANNLKLIIEKNPRVEKVWISNDGEDAVIQIMNIEPDIVFTDMDMPKRTGIDVIETIKGYPCVRKKTRFVLVTANRDPELYIKARELEFDIEHKPVNSERINKYINEFEPIEIDEEEETRKWNEEVAEVRKELKKEGFLKKLFKKKENKE